MSLIIIFILAGLVYYLATRLGSRFKEAWRFYKQVKSARRFAQDPFAEFMRNFGMDPYGNSDPRPGAGPNSKPAPRPKKIAKDVGEYIEFEEIDASATGSNCDVPPREFQTETQIIDVKWEDIP